MFFLSPWVKKSPAPQGHGFGTRRLEGSFARSFIVREGSCYLFQSHKTEDIDKYFFFLS